MSIWSRALSEDARNSLFALVCVSLFFGLAYLIAWLLPDDLPLPRWIGFAAPLIVILFQIVGWILRRRKRRLHDRM